MIYNWAALVYSRQTSELLTMNSENKSSRVVDVAWCSGNKTGWDPCYFLLSLLLSFLLPWLWLYWRWSFFSSGQTLVARLFQLPDRPVDFLLEPDDPLLDRGFAARQLPLPRGRDLGQGCRVVQEQCLFELCDHGQE